MRQGTSCLFNLITLVFVALTAVVILGAIAIAINALEPPFLAPDPTLVPPTAAVLPSLTPSTVPGAEDSLTLTPEAPAQ